MRICKRKLFVRLWSKRETLGIAGSVNYYLSFRRLLIGRLIANRKFTLPLQGEPLSIFEFILPVEDSIIEGESKNQQQEILQASKRQREAILIKFYNELSYYEVSSIMALRGRFGL